MTNKTTEAVIETVNEIESADLEVRKNPDSLLMPRTSNSTLNRRPTTNSTREAVNHIEFEGITAAAATQITTVNNETIKFEQVYKQIIESMRRDSIIRCEIVSVDADTREVTVMVDDAIPCTITDEEFFMPDSVISENYSSMTVGEQKSARYTRMQKMLGAWIPVAFTSAERVPVGTDPATNGTVYEYSIRGSRSLGMQRLQDKWFYHKEHNRNNNVIAGDTTDAYILIANESNIIVEAFGVETSINWYECTRKSTLTNCKAVYRPGQIMQVMVKTAEFRNGIPYISLSGRAFENRMNDLRKDFDRIKTKNTYFGVVDHITDKGHYIVTLKGFGGICADVNPTSVRGRVALNPGDRVTVVCIRKIEEGLFILGTAEKK